MTQTLLTLERYLEVLQHDTEALAVVLDQADGSLPVRSCPGWTLSDLGYHVGEVHRFWHWVVREGVREVTDANSPQFARPDDADLAGWLRHGLADFLPVLRAVDPAAPAWSWTPQRDMAFIQRRMPHETSVHRWDAEDAAAVGVAGTKAPSPIAPDLAADGVSEFFLLASAGRYESHAPVAFRAVDTGHAWTASVDDGRMRVVDGVAQASVVLTGCASDLLLTLWRRLLLLGDPRQGEDCAEGAGSGVLVDGDEGLAQTFLGLVDLT